MDKDYYTNLAVAVAANDERPGTTQPTGRTAGKWAEFYEAIPGAGYLFWAAPYAGDISYLVVEWVGEVAPTESDLDRLSA